MRRTYLDTGVLIDAAAGKGARAEVALNILDDRARVFLSCPFLDFELLPQAILNESRKEQKFLETYPAGTGKASIRRTIAPKSRRVK
jgi:hypothetical protein